jgi:hypothetical protein
MWLVLASALAARRGQAVIVVLVALAASAAVVAAPWYAVAASQRVGVSAVASAPAEERLISITRLTGWRGADDSSSAEVIDEARRQFRPPGFSGILGGFTTGELRVDGTDGSDSDDASTSDGDSSGTAETDQTGSDEGDSEESANDTKPAEHAKTADEGAVEVNVAYRENICEHLALTGECPRSAGEVVLPESLVRTHSLELGDDLDIKTGEEQALRVRLVGAYRVIDPGEAYWGDGTLVGLGEGSSSDRPSAFTVRETLRGQERASYGYDLVATPRAFATADVGRLSAQLATDLERLRQQGYTVTTTNLDTLLERISRDRFNVVAGVGVGVAILLLLTWFALTVVVRQTAVQVRADVGWWRLHGAPSARGWLLVLGQSIVPLIAGALVGTAAGLGLGRVLGGDIAGGADQTALTLSLLLVGLALAGAFVAVVATQIGTLVTPVRDLLRRTPSRRARWRRSVVDLVLILLAAYGVGQTLLVTRQVRGLPLLAPGLAALALALVAAWAVPPLASWLARRSHDAGRLSLGLTTALLARRPETHRLFALVAVAVALVTTGFVGVHTAERTQWQRAALQVGADRVLIVDAEDPAQLLAAVRAVDPDGTQAMAVVDQQGGSDDEPRLAVDTTRLAVVVGWREEYGGDLEAVAKALRPKEPRPVVIEGDRLAFQAAATEPKGAAVYLRIRLRTLRTGEPVDAVVGPLAERRDSYAASVPACADGCRLVGVQVLGAPRPDAVGGNPATAASLGHAAPEPATQVELFPATGPDRESSIPADVLTEPTRWRPALGPRDVGPSITAGAEGLRITVSPSPEVPLERSDWAFVVDTPVTLPVLTAGWRPDPVGELRVPALPGAAVPAEVVRRASLVPRHEKVGTIADLTYAERLVPFSLAGSGTPQVWLSPTAPASIVDELREAGVSTLRVESLADRLEHLRAEGTAVGGRLQAVVALVGLLLAAGAVLVDAERERPSRGMELAALRAQGVPARVIRGVGYGGPAALVVTATVVGLVGGLIGAAIARVSYPGFVDGWAVLPTASAGPIPVLLAAGVCAVVLGAVVVAAGAAQWRTTRGRS